MGRRSGTGPSSGHSRVTLDRHPASAHTHLQRWRDDRAGGVVMQARQGFTAALVALALTAPLLVAAPASATPAARSARSARLAAGQTSEPAPQYVPGEPFVTGVAGAAPTEA